jgi:hypothetical protein
VVALALLSAFDLTTAILDAPGARSSAGADLYPREQSGIHQPLPPVPP